MFSLQQISPGLVKTEFAARAHDEPGRVMEGGVDAKNIADAVVYILSTPPELQVICLPIAQCPRINVAEVRVW